MSARALGALVKELGEENCSDLFPWLMETLISESSSVDRSGAAQGKIVVQAKFLVRTDRILQCVSIFCKYCVTFLSEFMLICAW